MPRAVPSLYGAFPDSMRDELQGFVSEPDWRKGGVDLALSGAKSVKALS